MREILFRAKTKDGKEWLEGYFTKLNENSVIILKEAADCYNKDIGKILKAHDLILVDPETVCQYTGLTDKNGRKIFEGDIVKAIYKPKDEDLTIDDFIIKWDKYYCKFVGHYTNKENVYNPLLFGSQTSFEVIGNIFDNPELIGDQP